MAKINATYGSGYYLAPDTDYRKLEEEQQLEWRRKRRLERKDGNSSTPGEDKVIRQTFAIPFNVICLHCNRRIARGTHGYVNRRPTENKYMGIRIWELEFRCIFCKEHIYLITDYETAKITGGYHCSRNCRRGEGDFYGVNQINEAVRTRQAEEAAEKGSLDALERESEVVQRLQESERLVEELVESRANTSESQIRDELLHAIQAKRKQSETGGVQQQNVSTRVVTSGDDVDDCDGGEGSDDNRMEAEEKEYQRFEAWLCAWRKKQEEEEEAQLKDNTENNEKMAAIIIAKYSSGENKARNAFMVDSDAEDNSDGDRDEQVGLLKKEGSLPSPLQKTDLTSGSVGGVFSGRRQGGALASLLDD